VTRTAGSDTSSDANNNGSCRGSRLHRVRPQWLYVGVLALLNVIATCALVSRVRDRRPHWEDLPNLAAFPVVQHGTVAPGPNVPVILQIVNGSEPDGVAELEMVGLS